MEEYARHEYFMRLALEEAEKAREEDEVPVGCVLVKGENVLARTHNLKEQSQDPTTHAEVLAIRQASKQLQNWRLIDTTLYVTLEPCLMCAGAMILARIPLLVFGTTDLKTGAACSLLNAFQLPVNHQVEVRSGILQSECSHILSTFFQQKRAQGKK